LALKALRDHLVTGKVRHVDEADIQGCCTHLKQEWLRRMISLRIADPVLTGLMGTWLQAGVMAHGVVARPDAGTPQGGPIAPGLAHAYLHYVLDVWCEKRAKKDRQGAAYLTRFVDDVVVALPYKRDAERFDRTLKVRMQRFGLRLAPDKTRLIRFGRFARERAKRMAGSPALSSFWGSNTSAGSTPRGSLRSSAFRQRKAAGHSCRARLTGSSATATGAAAISSGTSQRSAKASTNTLRATDACPSLNACSPMGKSSGVTP
jgi:hypothetical protein